jgi:hypothetical protein
MRVPARLDFFSFGGLLGVFWHSRAQLLPYIVSASILSLLSCWDLLRGAGRVDFIVLGLAGYELVLGLTEPSPRG